MEAMTDSMNKQLAKKLDIEECLEFIHNGFYYEIFVSADTGYVVNVYSSDDKDEYGEYIEENCIDGGLCTGNSRDAVGFML